MNDTFSARFSGIAFAFAAAMCNGTVGVLSRTAFEGNVDPIDVAFWRCAGAFMLFTAVAALRPRGFAAIAELAGVSWKIGICAALGIFTLYYFESSAFAQAPIPLVAVLVFGGGLGALVLDVVFLRERITSRRLIAIAMVFGGSSALIVSDGTASASVTATVFALIAGFGYASFMFAWKLFKLESTPAHLWWFFLYGGLLLFVPHAMNGVSLPGHRDLPILAALSVLPSFCGFYFTVLALKSLEASRTQVIEASEPVFSSLFGVLFFGELLSLHGLFGATAVIAGALVMAMPAEPPNRRAIGTVAGESGG